MLITYFIMKIREACRQLTFVVFGFYPKWYLDNKGSKIKNQVSKEQSTSCQQLHLQFKILLLLPTYSVLLLKLTYCASRVHNIPFPGVSYGPPGDSTRKPVNLWNIDMKLWREIVAWKVNLGKCKSEKSKVILSRKFYESGNASTDTNYVTTVLMRLK